MSAEEFTVVVRIYEDTAWGLRQDETEPGV